MYSYDINHTHMSEFHLCYLCGIYFICTSSKSNLSFPPLISEPFAAFPPEMTGEFSGLHNAPISCANVCGFLACCLAACITLKGF